MVVERADFATQADTQQRTSVKRDTFVLLHNKKYCEKKTKKKRQGVLKVIVLHDVVELHYTFTTEKICSLIIVFQPLLCLAAVHMAKKRKEERCLQHSMKTKIKNSNANPTTNPSNNPYAQRFQIISQDTIKECPQHRRAPAAS